MAKTKLKTLQNKNLSSAFSICPWFMFAEGMTCQSSEKKLARDLGIQQWGSLQSLHGF